jgi:hypothetical protein
LAILGVDEENLQKALAQSFVQRHIALCRPKSQSIPALLKRQSFPKSHLGGIIPKVAIARACRLSRPFDEARSGTPQITV